MDVMKSKRTRIEESFEIKLTGADILKLIAAAGLHDGDIPKSAEVMFHVPGGADWSNCSLEVDDYPITIQWRQVDEMEE